MINDNMTTSLVECSLKTNPWFRYEDKTEELNLVIFKDTPMRTYINGELSMRPFH